MRASPLIIIVALITLLATSPAWIHFGTLETVSVVVQDKERITTGVGGNIESKYLIFTDTETFENTDSWLALKFNSSDVYGKLEKGQKCNITVTGFRIPFFSSYRNILSAECS